MSKSKAPRPGAPKSLTRKIAKAAARLDETVDLWMQQWPHGVNPRALLERTVNPLVRQYRRGDLTYDLLDAMVEVERDLSREVARFRGVR